MKIDYKKEYKEFYLPKDKPALVTLPPISYAAVKGKGNPNTSQAYKEALELLYGVSFTIKMSKLGNQKFEGYFDYVVPPLEGLWQSEEAVDHVLDTKDKDRFEWISMIRLPEFINEESYMQAIEMLHKKKLELDVSKLFYFRYEEGLCVQCMHIGSYDDEPATLNKMNAFIEANGYITDINNQRWHHEIYLSDPRKTAPDKLKTVIRHPIKAVQSLE